MKYLYKKTIRRNVLQNIIIVTLTLILCVIYCESNIPNAAEVLKWQFGGFNYDYSLKDDIPMNYLVLTIQLLILVGAGRLIDLKNNNANVLIRFGRRYYWLKQSLLLMMEVVIYVCISVLTVLFFLKCIDMNIIIRELYPILNGIIIKVLPMYIIVLQIVMTMQLLFNPVIVITLFEALMIAILSLADKHLLIDNMFMYRNGLLVCKKEVFLFPLYIVVWAFVLMVGFLIVDKYEILEKNIESS